jgi:hypothetical protein
VNNYSTARALSNGLLGHHWLNKRKALCGPLFHRSKRLTFATMPDDPAHILNRLECQADFTDEITVKTIKIRDTGTGTKAVADDLEAVLRKIEGWRFYRRLPHQLQGQGRALA